MTLWAAPWTGLLGNPITPVTVGNRTGDGTINISSAFQGFFIFFVTNSANQFTNLVYQALTNGPIGTGPDAEACQAVIAKWTGSSLPGVVPGGIHKDALTKPSGTPYARIESKQGKDPMFSTGGLYIDYREVTISIYGVGDIAIGTIIPAVQAILNDKTLVFVNSAVSFMRCEPLGVLVAQEAEIKSGNEYRAAQFRYMIWTERSN